jgi:PAS domain S-box-containing protein
VDDALCSVVVIDDAAEMRALVRTQLSVSGRFTVVGEGRNGVDAIALAREHHPEIMLLDVSMPDLDGLEALSRIREVAPDTRVVMYTGFDAGGLASHARDLGAAAFIEKSTALDRLVDELDAVRKGVDTPAGRPQPAEHGVVDTAVLDEYLERFREVFEEAAIGMATTTLTGRIVRVNKAFAELVGFDMRELVGVAFVALATEQHRAAIIETLHRAQDGRGHVVQVEHEVLRAPDRCLQTTAAPVRDARGRPLYLFVQSQDVSVQRRTEEELRQSEQRFRLLVEAVRDYAIFMLDPDGVVASWNTGAERIKGYSAQEIIGQHFRVFYPPEVQAARHPENELHIARSEGKYEEEGWRIRKDGSRFWASVVITAIHNQQGELLGFAKVTRDMSERRKLLLEAEQAAVALGEANRELHAANARLAKEAADKAQFLAVTAHELRTPIGVLAGSAKLLVEHLTELTDEERAELSSSMTASASRLQRLLRDLLTAARLEANAVGIEMEDIDLSELLSHTVAAARATNLGAQIDLEVPTGLSVRGEADRLAQAVDNLLHNALRHGAPPVLLRASEVDGTVEIAVRDAGVGVPAERQARLFERFSSGSPRSSTGLGLFIVRELARAHGGDARYEPDPEGRPTFVIVLPTRRDAPS